MLNLIFKVLPFPSFFSFTLLFLIIPNSHITLIYDTNFTAPVNFKLILIFLFVSKFNFQAIIRSSCFYKCASWHLVLLHTFERKIGLYNHRKLVIRIKENQILQFYWSRELYILYSKSSLCNTVNYIWCK